MEVHRNLSVVTWTIVRKKNQDIDNPRRTHYLNGYLDFEDVFVPNNADERFFRPRILEDYVTQFVDKVYGNDDQTPGVVYNDPMDPPPEVIFGSSAPVSELSAIAITATPVTEVVPNNQISPNINFVKNCNLLIDNGTTDDDIANLIRSFHMMMYAPPIAEASISSSSSSSSSSS